VTSTALNHTALGAQHTQVLQVKCAQYVFDGVSQPDDSVLHIGILPGLPWARRPVLALASRPP
jgi:hypothetical protein